MVPARHTPIVFVVDDDLSVREALTSMIEYAGLKVESFPSAGRFLIRPRTLTPSCLVLDVDLPDLNGLDLQNLLASERRNMPIIFITGCGDIPMSVRAMKGGAVEFLTKPFDDEVLLQAIYQALERSGTVVDEETELRALRAAHASLTQREQDVMALVVAGLLNKQVGGVLGISEVTVKAHRGQVMRKMNARSLAELVIIATRLRLPSGAQPA